MIQQEFLLCCQMLLVQMQSGSVVLIFVVLEVVCSVDLEYFYWQNSDFWYFIGFNELEVLLVLIKSDEIYNYSVLFNWVCDLIVEIWFGCCLGQEVVLVKFGVDWVLVFSEINQQLYQLFNGLDVIYFVQGEYVYVDEIVFNVFEKLCKGLCQNLQVLNLVIDWWFIVYEMCLFKFVEEFVVMCCVGEIIVLVYIWVMEKCCSGMFEYQLEGEIFYEFNCYGVCFFFYNIIVGGGENGCILYYIENEFELCDGDLVLIDVGCEYCGYVGDIICIFLVNGKFIQLQCEIYDIVFELLEIVLKFYWLGILICQVNQEVVCIMIIGLVWLGILKGEIDEFIVNNVYCLYFMYGLSYWLGLDVYDVGNYDIDCLCVLELGMVLIVESGLYIVIDVDVLVQYCGIGICIEDDIVIIEDGNENFIVGVVKKVDEIEVLMVVVCQL